MGTLIVRRSDSLESLLACGIPDLKLDSFAIYINGSDLEVDADCWHEVVMEYIVLFNNSRLEKVMIFFYIYKCFYSSVSDGEKICTPHANHVLTANLRRSDDFPTPELPIRSTLKR